MARPPQHIHDAIEDKARTDGTFAIAYALLRLAEAQDRTATHLKYLGNGDAATTMGAIEGLAMRLGDSMGSVADAIRSHGEE